MKTGKGSSHALTRLAASYNEMQNDGRLLSNRRSLEVVRMRIQQLSERINFQDAPDRFKKVGRLWRMYRTALREDRRLDAESLSVELDAQFDAAYQDYAAWEQMMMAIDLDRRLVESEVKVAKDLHAMLTSEEAYELVAKLLAAVLRVISDPRQLKAIQYEFTRITGDGLVVEVDPGSGEVRD